MEFVFENGMLKPVDIDKQFLKDLRDAESNIDYTQRSRISKIYNRFSGKYWSPTHVKGFLDCPARCFGSSFIERKAQPYANLGSAIHEIYELIVSGGYWYDKNKCIEIMEDTIKKYELEEKDANLVRTKYLPNFMNYTDYKDNSKKFDWINKEDIQCFTEQFNKCDDFVIFDINLGSTYVLIDRIDVRSDGVYIIDYKSGYMKDRDHLINSYTDQLISYKWVVEKLYGIEVVGTLLYVPFNDIYVELPSNSLSLQSKLVEKVSRYYEEAARSSETFSFRASKNSNCNYCEFKEFCPQFNGDATNEKFNIPTMLDNIDKNKIRSTAEVNRLSENK